MSDDFVDPRDLPIRHIPRRTTVNNVTVPRVMTPAQRRNGKLTSSQKKLAGAAFIFGLIVTVAGWATNFLSVSDYADTHHFVIPQALPIGLDLAIPTLLVIDYLATVKGANAAFLRWAAWALTGFTVYAGAVSANGDSKGIDWNSTILHGVMPAISVIFVEAARWLRMYLEGLTDGTHTDRIPIARWICAPIRTARMRRRMVLWNERSYPMAVVREAALLYARALLDGEGRKRKTTPVSLLHQIRTGQVPSIVVQAMRTSVEDGDESWQPAVEDWVSGHLAKLAPDMRSAGHPDIAPDMEADTTADALADISSSPSGHKPDADTGHGRQADIRTDAKADMPADIHPDTNQRSAGRPAGHRKATTARTPDMSAGHASVPDADTDAHAPDPDMDTEAAALSILSGEPDISGAELGRRLGLSDRQGRRILNALTAGGRT
jgi:hypothetical protein